MINGNDVARIMVEVSSGAEPARPDTGEENEFRENIAREMEEIQERGDQVDIPYVP